MRKSIAVIGGGISGLSAAWLLSRAHAVTLFEADGRLGGHSNTVDVPGAAGCIAVDTGFIVYNTASYPNLIALFDHLGVPTAATEMSFAVSLDGGRYEYAGSGVSALFGQARNVVSPKHWRMILDIFRFFREAPGLITAAADEQMSLGRYLTDAGYSEAFIDRHIVPMAAAIWSTPAHSVLEFPAAAFVRFFANHGLLQASNRPQWRTVIGGSRDYVRRLTTAIDGDMRIGAAVTRITRGKHGVTVSTSRDEARFDACVIATHADQVLQVLADADGDERRLLGAFRYARNRAVLHRDATVMPRRRRLWSSWNYTGSATGRDASLSVTYWMNRLQPIGTGAGDLFVTLNPDRSSVRQSQISEFDYAHPIFDSGALQAQRRLWQLQGRRQTWFCGSYFGYGFHEDGLQSGLAVAEDIGGVRRPWMVEAESGRIHLGPAGAAPTGAMVKAAE